MRRNLARATLLGSGAILGLIGGALMVSPQAFLEMSHVLVDRDPGLMSELTAPSGVLLIAGALMLVGSVKLRFANLGLVVGGLVYGSYGLGRLVSMAIHGVPPPSLIAATLIELGVAAMLVGLRLTAPMAKWRNTDDAYLGESVI